MDNMFFRGIEFIRISTWFDAALNSLAAIGLTEVRDPSRLDVSNLPRPDLLARRIPEISSVWRPQRGGLTHRVAAAHRNLLGLAPAACRVDAPCRCRPGNRQPRSAGLVCGGQ